MQTPETIKKREGELIYFVLLSELGKAYVEEIAFGDLIDLLNG